MGRKKIQISRITDERNRQVTFNKRKFGVMKKAYELSVLCDCEIALIIFSSSNKLYQYASTDMDKVLLKYTEYNEPHESLTNKNIIEALNKKEHKNGACSPDSPEGDTEYSLTPRTEAKYSKIDEEFQMMMQRNQLNGSRVSMAQSSYSLPVSVPVNYGDSSLLQASPQGPHVAHTVSPRPSSSETDSVYASGGMLEISNGYPNSSSPLGESPPPPGAPGGSPSKQGKHSPRAGQTNLRVLIPSQGGPLPGDDVTADSCHSNGDRLFDESSQPLHTHHHHPQQSLHPHMQHNQHPQHSQHSQQQCRGGMTMMTPPSRIPLQTPSIPGMSGYSSSLSSFGAQDFSIGADMGLSSLGWSSHHQQSSISHPGGVPQLSVSSSTPPPCHSPLPLPLRIKSEPISPPRDPGSTLSSQQQQHGLATAQPPTHMQTLSITAGIGAGSSGGGGGTSAGNTHIVLPLTNISHSMSHGHALPRPSSTGHLTPTPTAGSVTPTNLSPPVDPRTSSDYENGPLQKRTRMSDGWAS